MNDKKLKVKPPKKTTSDLFLSIERSIRENKYYFTDHGEMRSKSRRKVTDEEVLKILEGNQKWHEKKKDKYIDGFNDWNYHIRGRNIDLDEVRIVVSFNEYGMPIITVINLDES